MAVLHRHRYPSLWTPQRVPLEPVEVDWSHPLANSLLALFIPGSPSAGFADITRQTPSLIPTTGGGIPIIASSPIGPALSSTVNGAGLVSPPGLAPILQVTTNVSMFVKGQQLAQSSNDTSYIGVKKQNAAGQAAAYTLMQAGGGYTAMQSTGEGTLCQLYNATYPGNVVSQGGTIAASTLNGGILYQNGVKVANYSGTVSASPFTYTGTAVLCLGNDCVVDRYSGWCIAVAGIWGRILSAAEMAWLDAEPFAMLRPIARRIFSFYQAAALPTRYPIYMHTPY